MIAAYFEPDGVPYVECNLFLPRLGCYGRINFLIGLTQWNDFTLVIPAKAGIQ